MSLLNENSFLRGETFEILLKIESIGYNKEKTIIQEINNFIRKKNNIYNGEYIKIFNVKNRGEANRNFYDSMNYINSCQRTKLNNIENQINMMFIQNGHIKKMIEKEKKLPNFKGCLVWSIPFHKEIEVKTIKLTFQKLNLNFDLYVFITGIGLDKNINFLVKKA